MRSSKGTDKGCCEECRHLSARGCTVRSLACKLWLCEENPAPKECVAELKALRLVAEYSGIPCNIRKSKEENFRPYLGKGDDGPMEKGTQPEKNEKDHSDIVQSIPESKDSPELSKPL